MVLARDSAPQGSADNPTGSGISQTIFETTTVSLDRSHVVEDMIAGVHPMKPRAVHDAYESSRPDSLDKDPLL